MKRHCLNWSVGAILVIGFVPVLLATGKHLLIVNRPVPSDVILVPSGDFTVRSGRARELAEQGYGKHVLIDEGSEVLTFGRTLAARRIEQTAGWPVAVSVCPVHGDSTFEEGRECEPYLQRLGARRVLIVTSDFHSRRALATYRATMPSVRFSVASVPTAYGNEAWWSPNAAATTIEEWGALLWLRISQGISR